jgi:hypothetical protein
MKLAEDIYPMHIAVVTAAFPYRQQWEEFRRALRKRTMNDLIDLNQQGQAAFDFQGFEIWRRVLTPDGKEKEGWSDYTERWQKGLKFVYIRAVGFEEDDAKIKPLTIRGLTGWRPLMARAQEYPKTDLKHIQDTVDALEKAAKDNAAAFYVPKSGGKLSGEGFDPTNPSGYAEERDSTTPAGPSGPAGPMPPGPAGPGDKGEGTLSTEPVFPEYLLARFLDVLIEPGYTYEYKFKVRMTNPNYKRTKDIAYPSLAKDELIKAKDFTKPVSLSVPPDFSYYLVDEKPERRADAGPTADKYTTPMQIHRWVGWEFKDPENTDSKTAFGEWVLLERGLFHRGEYIHRRVDTEVPYWYTETESWVLASTRQRERGRKIAMDFSTRTPSAANAALLVDFEGGKGRYQVGTRGVLDESPVQALILTPEGKLIVRNSTTDSDNEEREKRVKEWRAFLKEVKSGKAAENKPAGSGLFDNRGPGMPRGDR